MVVDAKGKLSTVSPETFKENKDKYMPITNAQLAQMRQTDPKLAFNSNIATVINNAVGPDKISDYILGIATKIGEDKVTRNGYVTKRQSDVSEGINALLGEGAPEGSYSITQSETGVSAEKKAKAIRYIISVLP